MICVNCNDAVSLHEIHISMKDAIFFLQILEWRWFKWTVCGSSETPLHGEEKKENANKCGALVCVCLWSLNTRRAKCESILWFRYLHAFTCIQFWTRASHLTVGRFLWKKWIIWRWFILFVILERWCWRIRRVQVRWSGGHFKRGALLHSTAHCRCARRIRSTITGSCCTRASTRRFSNETVFNMPA